MSSDVEAVLDATRSFHSTWSGLLDLSVGFYLIATIVKQSAFLAAMPSLRKCIPLSWFPLWLLTLSVAFLVTIRVSVKLVSARTIFSKCLQTRIAGTTQFLSQLKATKITGRSPLMFDYVSGLRKSEIDQSVLMRKLWIIIHTISTSNTLCLSSPSPSPLLSPLFYVLSLLTPY